MATKIENIAVAPVMLQPDSQDKYSPANLLIYRTSLALFRNMADDGIFNDEEYSHICTILTQKHGLPSGSIFAECA